MITGQNIDTDGVLVQLSTLGKQGIHNWHNFSTNYDTVNFGDFSNYKSFNRLITLNKLLARHDYQSLLHL